MKELSGILTRVLGDIVIMEKLYKEFIKLLTSEMYFNTLPAEERTEALERQWKSLVGWKENA